MLVEQVCPLHDMSINLKADVIVAEKDRVFTAILTSGVVDSQKEIMNMEHLKRVLRVLKEQGMAVNLGHFGVNVGDSIDAYFMSFGEILRKYKNNKKVVELLSKYDPNTRALLAQGKIKKRNKFDDMAWKMLENGEINGVSVGFGDIKTGKVVCDGLTCGNEIKTDGIFEMALTGKDLTYPIDSRKPSNKTSLILALKADFKEKEPSEIEIRKATKSDAESILNIAKNSLPEKYTKSYFDELLKMNNNSSIVASLNNKIVGYVMVKSSIPNSHISSVAVLPEYRGKGIAKKMLKNIAINLKSQNMNHLFLIVRKSNNVAINLYSKMEFDKLDVLKSQYSDGEDGILMNLNLKADFKEEEHPRDAGKFAEKPGVGKKEVKKKKKEQPKKIDDKPWKKTERYKKQMKEKKEGKEKKLSKLQSERKRILRKETPQSKRVRVINAKYDKIIEDTPRFKDSKEGDENYDEEKPWKNSAKYKRKEHEHTLREARIDEIGNQEKPWKNQSIDEKLKSLNNDIEDLTLEMGIQVDLEEELRNLITSLEKEKESKPFEVDKKKIDEKIKSKKVERKQTIKRIKAIDYKRNESKKVQGTLDLLKKSGSDMRKFLADKMGLPDAQVERIAHSIEKAKSDEKRAEQQKEKEEIKQVEQSKKEREKKETDNKKDTSAEKAIKDMSEPEILMYVKTMFKSYQVREKMSENELAMKAEEEKRKFEKYKVDPSQRRGRPREKPKYVDTPEEKIGPIITKYATNDETRQIRLATLWDMPGLSEKEIEFMKDHNAEIIAEDKKSITLGDKDSSFSKKFEKYIDDSAEEIPETKDFDKKNLKEALLSFAFNKDKYARVEMERRFKKLKPDLDFENKHWFPDDIEKEMGWNLDEEKVQYRKEREEVHAEDKPSIKEALSSYLDGIETLIEKDAKKVEEKIGRKMTKEEEKEFVNAFRTKLENYFKKPSLKSLQGNTNVMDDTRSQDSYPPKEDEYGNAQIMKMLASIMKRLDKVEQMQLGVSNAPQLVEQTPQQQPGVPQEGEQMVPPQEEVMEEGVEEEKVNPFGETEESTEENGEEFAEEGETEEESEDEYEEESDESEDDEEMEPEDIEDEEDEKSYESNQRVMKNESSLGDKMDEVSAKLDEMYSTMPKKKKKGKPSMKAKDSTTKKVDNKHDTDCPLNMKMEMNDEETEPEDIEEEVSHKEKDEDVDMKGTSAYEDENGDETMSAKATKNDKECTCAKHTDKPEIETTVEKPAMKSEEPETTTTEETITLSKVEELLEAQKKAIFEQIGVKSIETPIIAVDGQQKPGTADEGGKTTKEIVEHFARLGKAPHMSDMVDFVRS